MSCHRCCSDPVHGHPAMAVFTHHCYELQRGLRNLVLHTAPREHLPVMEATLRQIGLSWHVGPLNEHRINLFFGREAQVAVIRAFGDKRLNEHSPEEDFILGAMLGYDGTQQCERYLKRWPRTAETVSITSADHTTVGACSERIIS